MNSHSLVYTVKTKRGEVRQQQNGEPFGLNKNTRRIRRAFAALKQSVALKQSATQKAGR